MVTSPGQANDAEIPDPAVLAADEVVIVDGDEVKITALFVRSTFSPDCGITYNVTTDSCNGTQCGALDVFFKGDGCRTFLFFQPQDRDYCTSRSAYFVLKPKPITSDLGQALLREILKQDIFYQCDELTIHDFLTYSTPRDTISFEFDTNKEMITDTSKALLILNQLTNGSDDTMRVGYHFKHIALDVPQCTCPSGFIDVNCTCYSLFFNTSHVTWSEAVTYCNEFGGEDWTDQPYLLTLTSEAELSAIRRLVSSHWGTKRLLRTKSWIFIGLQRIRKVTYPHIINIIQFNQDLQINIIKNIGKNDKFLAT